MKYKEKGERIIYTEIYKEKEKRIINTDLYESHAHSRYLKDSIII